MIAPLRRASADFHFPIIPTDSNPTPIPVVCALIEHAGRVLLAQRSAGKHLGGKWEFPGGKVEPGETPDAALVREISEELGCTITVIRALPPCVHNYATVRIELMPFVCALAADSAPPTSREHAAIAWVRPTELLARDLAPADIPVAEHYLLH
ncbi:MAG: (deoxy)nucleoside triphosphate pyrophosphohydrolase [Opitutaceae bacterium]|nr:(deoxy)nucleoside triphosphate pyrophosphohydrolase [Opitutaceae bacterium]